MSHNNSGMDLIIRKIEKEDTPPPGYKTFIFDTKNSAVLPKERFSFGLGKKTERYIISTNETAKVEGFALILDNGIGINISYTARCAQGHESKVLTSLYDQDSVFESVLNEKLSSYIRNFTAANTVRITYSFLESLRDEISQKCLSETGLVITPVITFQAENNLKKISLKSNSFSVRVVDYHDSLNLDYEIEIHPSETNFEMALRKTLLLDDLKVKLNELIYDIIWKNGNLNLFCLSLNSATTGIESFNNKSSIKELLLEPVNQLLALEGRQLGFLRLTSSTIENIKPPDQIDIDHPYSYKIADDNEKVVVKSNLSLKLFDIAAYKKAEEKYKIRNANKDFKDWFKESVITPLIKDFLFTKRYEDILIDPDTIKNQIKDEISRKAEEVGFRIKQHMYMPEIKNLKLRDGFKLLLENASFTTKSSSFEIKFNINIKGKISDLSRLKNKGFLLPNVDIETEMRKGILSTLEYKILKIPPENIYLRNESPSSLGEQETVERSLQDAVISYLTETYSVDSDSLVVIINFSEKEDLVHKTYEHLKKTKNKIVVSGTPSNKEEISFTIIYEIIGIRENGWERFSNQISKKKEDIISEIEEVLRNKISSALNNCTYEEVFQLDADKLIDARIFAPAFEAVSKTFGLFFLINSSNREKTVSEIASLNIYKQIIAGKETEITNNITVDYSQYRLAIEGYKTLLKKAINDDEFETVNKLIGEISKLETAIKDSITKSNQTLTYSLPGTPSKPALEAKPDEKDNTEDSIIIEDK